MGRGTKIIRLGRNPTRCGCSGRSCQPVLTQKHQNIREQIIIGFLLPDTL